MTEIPTYPELRIDYTDQGVVELPSDPYFNTFQHDCTAARVRSQLEPSSPGREPRVVEVRYVVANAVWRGWNEPQRLAFARQQLELAINYRTAAIA